MSQPFTESFSDELMKLASKTSLLRRLFGLGIEHRVGTKAVTTGNAMLRGATLGAITNATTSAVQDSDNRTVGKIIAALAAGGAGGAITGRLMPHWFVRGKK